MFEGGPLQAARGLGAGTDSAYLRSLPVRELGTAKWKLWHGRTDSCLGRRGKLLHWLDCRHVRDARGASAARRHIGDLVEYLRANRRALVNYGRRRHDRLPILTAFVESAVNEIFSKRMIKKQQKRWTRWTVQPFLMCASRFSTRRCRDHSNGDIPPFKPRMTITLNRLRHNLPTSLHTLDT